MVTKKERFLGNSTFREIHRFFREALLPLGFEERIGDNSLFPQATYSRPNIAILIVYDVREQDYSISVSAEGLSTFGAFTPDLKTKEARAVTFSRFQAWLIKNQIH